MFSRDEDGDDALILDMLAETLSSLWLCVQANALLYPTSVALMTIDCLRLRATTTTPNLHSTISLRYRIIKRGLTLCRCLAVTPLHRRCHRIILVIRDLEVLLFANTSRRASPEQKPSPFTCSCMASAAFIG